MSFRARPYQEVAVNATVGKARSGRRALLLHLPTGAGKTVIATLVVQRLRERRQRMRTLFVAHRREIIDQTARTIAKHLPSLRIGVEQGERSADGDPDVVIASVQTLVRRKERYDPSRFGLVIADECHRALAPTWTSVLDYFRSGLPRDGLLLGMTATPRRTDGRSVVDVFDEVAYEISRAELQDLGYLSPMRYFNVKADLHLDRVKCSGGDFQVGSLSKVMGTPAVRALTLRAWQARNGGASPRKTLVFCAGLEHARQLAADFAEAFGVRTGMVHGRSPDRAELLARFADGDLDVLTNFGVLTEGFDEPSIECILMARPTRSPLVYTQCIGRGLRTNPGKSDCTVIDIVDRSAHQLQYGASHMAGLPSGWRTRGRDPFREARALRGVQVTDPAAFVRVRSATSLEAVQSLLMELPPETVMAGLDGQPVPRYLALDPPEPPPPTRARGRVLSLLEQAGARWRRVEVTDDTVHVRFVDARTNNERYDYLLWHLERVSGRRVAYYQPPERRRPRPRAALRSMLRPGLTLGELRVVEEQARVEACIVGLRPHEGDWLRATFLQQTGFSLDLGGQLAFEF